MVWAGARLSWPASSSALSASCWSAWLDDKHELRPRAKFAGQFIVAALVAASGVRITLFVPSVLFSYAVTILWILTVINAFNFMDNMNGLCAGLGAIGAGYFAVLAAADGQYLVALIAFLTFGALLGFLPVQLSPRPRLSRRRRQSPRRLPAGRAGHPAALPHGAAPAALGGPDPVAGAGRPAGRPGLGGPAALAHRPALLLGDTNHLSHRLVRRGLSRTQAVLVIWLAARSAC